MKVYKFTAFGDSWWICAKNLDEAKQVYEGDSESSNLVIEEVPEDTWSTSYIFDPDQPEPEQYDEEDNLVEYNEDEYSNGYKIICSFADFIADCKTSEVMCSTEW